MTHKKAIKRIEILENEQVDLFKTYKQNNGDTAKIKHLRRMADVIEEKALLKIKHKIK
jgi:hypothetical protein